VKRLIALALELKQQPGYGYDVMSKYSITVPNDQAVLILAIRLCGIKKQPLATIKHQYKLSETSNNLNELL